ncbi:ubiquitin-conjugating enzyme E2 T-like [Amphibalanus amphitrite]|uniref:ubiquitin-conjugating enzyme E2 T-like n=1 Tax=Amphibalanus amphitrite TaxID=1232801 RepID=UPI001C910DD1|nr:ubiquitin-conjugating enzyme E2 T-like [Amphibalanus amphitrite]XP_043232722.1 ubiquitin-conjugating enzyme E2 T-like [Amphibalanus amphitrite]XP_043232732.1 ubiquitin-conjugating enzyme E2 T-like [Amphibalanus amphitrite]XP_043232739.1 ubiquitin-conjugating enzyme E2 T-like [Amphibalanus amphitrite]XP_043232747.1 ubiquitin-conjugating enzyme E2 T-like [Amphibalanus amphitrite]XP_043232758.1 ubiquitin-conjugating enzyme E2 T-like [Amphibalanus amphitrite]
MQRAARLKKELAMLAVSPPAGVCCAAEGDDITRLKATITGPEGSPFEQGTFQLDVVVPERYPFEPPQVTFSTPVYHPNVDPSGRICLGALKMPPTGDWRPSLQLATLLLSVRVLLAEPNPDDPLMPDIAEQYRCRRQEYEHTAAEMTAKHAVPQSVLSPIENRSTSPPGQPAVSGKQARAQSRDGSESPTIAPKRARPSLSPTTSST